MPMPWEEYGATASAPPWQEYAQAAPQPTAGSAVHGAVNDIGSALSGIASLAESTYGVPLATLAKYVVMGGNLAHLTNINPQEAQQRVQQFLVGQPSGAPGQAIVGAAGLPARAVQAGAQTLEQNGVPGAQHIAQGAIDAATLLGAGRGANAVAEGATDIANARGVQAAQPASIPEALQAVGYKDLPSKSGGGVVARAGESVAGGRQVAAAQSLTNQQVDAALAKHDAGVPQNQELNYQTVQDARNGGPATVYNQVQNALPEVIPQTPALAASLKGIGDTTSTLPRSPDVDALRDSLVGQQSLTREQLFANIQQARARAGSFYKQETADGNAMGEAYTHVANAYEDAAQEQLQALPNPPVSVEDFQQARVQFAKNYAVQNALKGTAVQPSVIATMQRHDPSLLTGGLQLIAEHANRNPLSSQFGPATLDENNVSFGSHPAGRMVGAGVGGAVGAGAGLLVHGAPGAVIGGTAGTAIGTGVTMAIQSLIKRALSGDPEAQAQVAVQAANDPRLAQYFQDQVRGTATPTNGPPEPPEGMTASTPQAPPKAAPAAPAGPSYADVLSQGVGEGAPGGLSLAPAPGKGEGIPFKPSPEVFGAKTVQGGSPPPQYPFGASGEPLEADDTSVPLGSRFSVAPTSNSSELPGVMSQGVPEGIAQRTPSQANIPATDFVGQILPGPNGGRMGGGTPSKRVKSTKLGDQFDQQGE